MSASATARWSPDQEATLLARMAEGASLEKVAAELGKSVTNVQMKWSIIRLTIVEESKEDDEPVPVSATVVPDYSAELQAIKDAVAALEARLKKN